MVEVKQDKIRTKKRFSILSISDKDEDNPLAPRSSGISTKQPYHNAPNKKRVSILSSSNEDEVSTMSRRQSALSAKSCRQGGPVKKRVTILSISDEGSPIPRRDSVRCGAAQAMKRVSILSSSDEDEDSPIFRRRRAISAKPHRTGGPFKKLVSIL